MEQATTTFPQIILEAGMINIPIYLLNKIQALDISPESVGYLVLALNAQRTLVKTADLSKDPWVSWALGEGWAIWEGKNEDKKISFSPLWQRLYYQWETEQQSSKDTDPIDFDYNRILKELDRLRGSLAATLEEKRFIQDMNLRYGWSTDFILTFFELSFTRGSNQMKDYKQLANRIHQRGIFTLEQLTAFMNEVDWTQKKLEEIKRYLGQYGGVTIPQRDMYLKWNKHWDLSHSLILRAAEETIRANNANFRYLDSILKNWHELGVKDIAQAEQAIKDHDNKKKPQISNPSRRVTHTGSRNWEKE